MLVPFFLPTLSDVNWLGWAWPTGGPEEPVPDRVPALHHDPVGARGALRHGRQGFQHVLVPVDGGPPPASLHGGTTTILPSFTGFHMFFLFCFFFGFIAPRASGKVQPDVGDAAVHAGPRRQHSRHVPTVPGAARLTRRLVALFFSFFFFCLLTTLRPSLLSRLLFIGNSLSHFPFG